MIIHRVPSTPTMPIVNPRRLWDALRSGSMSPLIWEMVPRSIAVRRTPCLSGQVRAGTKCAIPIRLTPRPSPVQKISAIGWGRVRARLVVVPTCTLAASSTLCFTCSMHASGRRFSSIWDSFPIASHTTRCLTRATCRLTRTPMHAGSTFRLMKLKAMRQAASPGRDSLSIVNTARWASRSRISSRPTRCTTPMVRMSSVSTK